MSGRQERQEVKSHHQPSQPKGRKEEEHKTTPPQRILNAASQWLQGLETFTAVFARLRKRKIEIEQSELVQDMGLVSLTSRPPTLSHP